MGLGGFVDQGGERMIGSLRLRCFWWSWVRLPAGGSLLSRGMLPRMCTLYWGILPKCLSGRFSLITYFSPVLSSLVCPVGCSWSFVCAVSSRDRIFGGLPRFSFWSFPSPNFSAVLVATLTSPWYSSVELLIAKTTSPKLGRAAYFRQLFLEEFGIKRLWQKNEYDSWMKEG